MTTNRILIVAKCVVALQERPMTLKELSVEVHCVKATSRNVVNRLLKANLVEFKGWGPRNGSSHLPAIYGWAPGPQEMAS